MSTSKPLPHTLSAWLKELDGVRLPVSNDEHRRALHTLRDNKSSLGEIAESLQASPTLALLVMRAANRSKSSLSDPAANLEVALSRLGLQTTENLLNQQMPVSPEQIPRELRQLQLLSRHASQQASGLFGARLARLWHDVHCSSLLLLAPLWPLIASHPQLFNAWEQRVLIKGEPASKVERELLGLPLLQICLALAEKWRLPEWVLLGYRLLLNDRRQLVKALRIARANEQPAQQQPLLDDDSPLRRWLTLPSNCILLANGLAVSAHQAWSWPLALRWQQLTGLYLQLNLGDLQQQVHQQAVNSARKHCATELWHPAQALLWPWHCRHLHAEQPLAAAAPLTTEVTAWRKHCAELLSEPSPFANVLQLTSCIRDALQACGMQRLLLLLADRSHSRLMAQQTLGLPKEASVLSLDPNHSKVLRQLLSKPAQLRLSPANIAQYSALLPGNLKSLFPSEQLILRSIASQERVAMLLIVDQSGAPFSEASLLAFGKTVQCIERALASFAKRSR
ncbi:MAG: HDOD domain-containing protein [Pseudomonas sp.]|uniref:HDOD domain-containing protein n=1 Tax=Pseudomonas sp. TaxID=306 RepID=UPI002732A398|nr:HDOD domain-containing protein [Pseudomonas sp.]MDP3847145.1 HDOD domain-containing protein [Pseudomonas sp.]